MKRAIKFTHSGISDVMESGIGRVMALRFIALAGVLWWLVTGLAGCAYPEPEQSNWRWKEYNPNYRPLPGDPSR